MPKILIVDDNAMNILAVSSILKLQNPSLTIFEAQNGQIAVEKYKESLDKPCNCPCKGFKLVLMDIQMPVMGGIEATQ